MRKCCGQQYSVCPACYLLSFCGYRGLYSMFVMDRDKDECPSTCLEHAVAYASANAKQGSA